MDEPNTEMLPDAPPDAPDAPDAPPDAPPDEMVLNIGGDPVDNYEIRTTLVRASELVNFLSKSGGKIFNWRYPRDEDGGLTRYRVDTNLRWPLSAERQAEIYDYVQEMGGSVKLMVHATLPYLDPVAGTEHFENVTFLVMEFPVVLGA